MISARYQLIFLFWSLSLWILWFFPIITMRVLRWFSDASYFCTSLPSPVDHLSRIRNMDPTFPLVPIMNFLAALLVCLPTLSSAIHSGSWNVAVLSFAFWTTLSCIIMGINSIIWSDNVRDVAPVWCDISKSNKTGRDTWYWLFDVNVCSNSSRLFEWHRRSCLHIRTDAHSVSYRSLREGRLCLQCKPLTVYEEDLRLWPCFQKRSRLYSDLGWTIGLPVLSMIYCELSRLFIPLLSKSEDRNRLCVSRTPLSACWRGRMCTYCWNDWLEHPRLRCAEYIVAFDFCAIL